MNKKFSTLVASFLLAGGTFSVMAQNAAEEWVTVDASQLVTKSEYRILNEKGDSIVINSNIGTGIYNQANTPAPALAKFNTQADTWVLEKTKNGFSLKAKSTDNPVYYWNSGVAVALFTNVPNQTATEFKLNDDGTLSVVGKDGFLVKSWNNSTNNQVGLVLGSGDDFVPTKFKFQTKVSSVATSDIVKGSDVLDKIEGAIYIMNDGKYVGVSKKTALRSVSSRLQTATLAEFNALSEEEQRAFVWVAENGAVRSAFAEDDLYLTANTTTGVLTTVATPASLSFENGVLSVDRVGAANVSILSSTILPPYDYADLNPADEDASQVVLYATNGQAINYAGKAVDYNTADATKTIWSLAAVEISKDNYELRLKNGEGKYLIVGNQYVTVKGVDEDVEFDADGKYTLPENGQIVLAAGDKYVTVEGGALAAVEYRKATIFGFGQTGTAYLTGKDLLVRYRDYFKMAITYDPDGDDETDLTGVFDGELIPVSNASYNGGYFHYDAATSQDQFMLINSEEKILVINTSADANISSGALNHVYRLELVTPKEYFLDQNADKSYYRSNFKFEFEAGKTGDDITTAKTVYIDDHKLGAYKDGQDIILVAADNVALKPILIEINPKQNVVDAKKWLTKPVYYTVEVINKTSNNYGKVLGLGEGGAIQFVSSSKTDITKPEGQFAISYNAEYPVDWDYVDGEWTAIKAPRYVFVNRENNAESGLYNPSALYTTSDANVFVYGRDTLAIKPVTDFTSADGFRRLTADELNENTFTVAMNLLDESYLYVTENHADKHRLGLDREDATEWRIELPTFNMLDRVGDKIKVATDTVTIATPITYYDGKQWRSTAKYVNGVYNKKYYVPATELKVVTYILKNTANGEYFYGKDFDEEVGNAYYVCKPAQDQQQEATRIALKKVGENTLNLIPAYFNGNNWSSNTSWFEYDYVQHHYGILAPSKIIGGTTSASGVLKDVSRYSATTNDLFVIAPTAAPTYKKLAVGDKIVISRAANTDEVVYEKGEFAGINNIKAYEKINPALFVDTAYVDRVGNYKYQYLLGVNITSVDSTEQCNNPAHAGLHTAYTEGRFLVNMVDSAVAEFENDVHTNKYVYDGETKLAFVNALHQNDSLYVLDAAGKVESKSEVGNAAEHYAKFAFRMLNEADNEFVIETLLDKGGKGSWKNTLTGSSWINEPTKGYLRWHNGNLVVTEDIEEAEHFTLEATDATPTANEAVAAEVSVVATQGAIIVKGAAGKVVTVANILGQTIANQVAASDNVTIAAPVGIAVVTVDGEATKVVVK